ncbi:MAG: hypothetical protein ACI8RH_000088 [Flavobacteriales bacterium]|jgi:hypothetical protein
MLVIIDNYKKENNSFRIRELADIIVHNYQKISGFIKYLK